MGLNGSFRMPSTRLLIRHILQKKSIIDYLAKQGHEPIRALSGGRFSYLCPLPWHSETKPSFIVWTFSDYENFYCFGCQSKHNIIHLISHMEGKPVRQVIDELSEGFDVSVVDERKFQQDLIRLRKDDPMIVPPSDPASELSGHLLYISSVCNYFLDSVKHDEAECSIVDNLWKLVDKSLIEYDIESIETIAATIDNMVVQRQEKAQERYIEKMRKKYKEGE